MTKMEASASCSALILRSGHLAASRRMAARTLVAILRDAREERAPQDEGNTSLQGSWISGLRQVAHPGMATIEIYRHARACRGHPRLSSSPKEDVDGRGEARP